MVFVRMTKIRPQTTESGEELVIQPPEEEALNQINKLNFSTVEGETEVLYLVTSLQKLIKK